MSNPVPESSPAGDRVDPRDRRDLVTLSKLDGDSQVRRVLRWLAGEDERRASLGRRVLVATGYCIVPQLVAEAALPRRTERQRLAILAAIDELGDAIEAGQWYTLQFAATRYGPAVADKVRQILSRRSRSPHTSGPVHGPHDTGVSASA